LTTKESYRTNIATNPSSGVGEKLFPGPATFGGPDARRRS